MGGRSVAAFRSCRSCGAALEPRVRRCSQCGTADAAWYHGTADRSHDVDLVRLWAAGGLALVVRRRGITPAEAIDQLDTAGAFDRGTLTSTQVRWLFGHLDGSAAAAAEHLNVSVRTVRRWRKRLAVGGTPPSAASPDRQDDGA